MPLPPFVAVRLSVGAVTTPVWLTAPSDCNVTDVSVVNVPKVRSVSSRKVAVFSVLVDEAVPITLFCVPRLKSPLPDVVAVSVSAGAVTTPVCVTEPFVCKVTDVSVVNVPNERPPSSRNDPEFTVFVDEADPITLF